MFKVGDKVQIIRSEERRFLFPDLIGIVCTILDISDIGSGRIKILVPKTNEVMGYTQIAHISELKSISLTFNYYI